MTPPAADPWFANFADAHMVPVAPWVGTLPDRRSFAVLCGGAAYRVNAHDPEDWQEFSVSVWQPPHVLAAQGLVLFVDFTGVRAWGADGFAWDSGGLVYDDLRIIGADGWVLTLEGSAPPTRTCRFHLDLRTGASDDAPLPARPSPVPFDSGDGAHGGT